MKITEILVESHQLDEGPILNKIGAGIGKAAGTVAKGVGAVAGGIAGVGGALKKGFQAGKKAVSMAGDDSTEEPAAQEPAAGGAPAQSAPAAGGAPAAQKVPAKAAARSQFNKLSAAANGQAPAADPAAGGSQYAQVKANIDKLDKKGKQRILQLLQKEVGTAPAAPATPAADPGAGAMGNMAGQLAKGGAAKPNTMANAPVSKTNTAKPGNPNAAPAATEPAATEPAAPAAPKRTGGKVAGKLSQTPGAIRKREATARKGKQKPAAPSQAEIDADREKIMGVTSDSIIRTRPMMAESFSLFRKR